jgi:hypothetical protein
MVRWQSVLASFKSFAGEMGMFHPILPAMSGSQKTAALYLATCGKTHSGKRSSANGYGIALETNPLALFPITAPRPTTLP